MSAVMERQESAPAEATTPADFVRIALQNGAGMEQVSQLLDLQERWEANEARKAFVKAMAAFRAEAPSLAKQSQGHNYKFTSLDHITAKVNPILSKHGLSFRWVTQQDERITVHCDVTHEQGHCERVSLSGAPDATGSKNAIQAIGSTVSYLSRYTLLSALGLATGGQDDDGHSSVSAISQEQVATLIELIEESAVTMPRLLAYLNVESLQQIPASQFERARKALEKKAREANDADS